MSEGEDAEGIDISMGISNAEVGDVEKVKFQELRRISVPVDFVRSSDFEVGDDIYLVFEGDKISIVDDFEEAAQLRSDILDGD